MHSKKNLYIDDEEVNVLLFEINFSKKHEVYDLILQKIHKAKDNILQNSFFKNSIK